MAGTDEPVGAVRAGAGGSERRYGPGSPSGLFGTGGGDRPTGLLLAHRGGEHRIVVVDAGDRDLLSLGPFPEEDVVAIWRSIAELSGLQLVLPALGGGHDRPFPQLGRLIVGPNRPRRRLAVLNGRRPRFLVKRKFARLPARPHVHRGRELADGRGA